jgi:hypothetical protein
MNSEPVNIEELKMKEANENFEIGKYSKKVQRRLLKKHGLSFADQLKRKFKQQNLKKLNSK